jgi:hypothetical protein
MMSLLLHICTGLGLALAAGIRPFTPALAAGGLARAHAAFGFSGTHYAFLESGWFLLAVAAGFLVCAVVRAPAVRELVASAGVALGGILFAAVLAAHHDTSWPGLLGGALVAGIALYASRPVFDGASARLGDGAAEVAVLLYADAVALVVALACWFAGPLSLVVLAFLGSLAWAQRGRAWARLGVLRVPR